MKLTILGCYAATPTALTNPTAQILELKNHVFLIDCGEGTQVQLRKKKIKFSRIKHIFISHLHGDHFFGLMGLVSTFKMLNRKTPLHIYGPKGIKSAMTLLLKVSNSWTDYPLLFQELEEKDPKLLFEDETVSVTTIPLQHRIYCNGFYFEEKPGDRKLDIDAVREHHVDVAYYRAIKKGKDITLDDGTVLPNQLLTKDPLPTKSYAFCSDTRYDEKKLAQLEEVTLLYHEATFLEAHKQLCEATGHSTAIEAATMAKKANAGALLLGHYSTRYTDIEAFRTEAQTVFDTVLLAEDGKVFEF